MAARRITWPDLVLAAVLLVFGLFGTAGAANNQGQSAPLLSYVLVAAACLPLVLWRFRPTWAFALTGAATMTYLGLGYVYGPILFALLLAIYGLAVRSPVRHTVVSMAVLSAASVVAIAIGVLAGDRSWTEFLTVAAWLVVPAGLGTVLKIRRDAAADVRAEQARRAVSEERLQLAQEVHDVVGHGLAVIAMQAGVALRVLDREPARVREALEAIRATSKEALDGLRAELDALRTESALREAPRHPVPGLADLSGLAERIRSSGLPVTMDLGRGDAAPDGVPPAVDHAAYRIVQESLTNVLRHGGPDATARLRIHRDGTTLHIEVLDTGRGGVAAPGGHGIEGMRERARALGGAVEAGPRPAGGFAVTARLPATTSSSGGTG